MAAGGFDVGFEQGRLCDFAVELGDFELVGLFVVAEQLRRFDCFFPVSVLLVDVEQVFARAFGHVAVLQGEEDLFGAVDQARALVGFPQLKEGALFFVADGVGQFAQGFQQADGFVVFTARTVELSQGEVQVVRLRLQIGHFRQLVCGFACVAVYQGFQAGVKTGRDAFGLLQYGFHVDAGGNPAQGEADKGQQGNQHPPCRNIVFHRGLFFLGGFGGGDGSLSRSRNGGGSRGGDVGVVQAGGLFHFGTQAAVFRTQAQQAAEQGEDAEQCADDEHAEQQDDERRIHALFGQVVELHGLSVDDGQY